MRPQRFQDFTLSLAQQDGALAVPLSETSETRYPYGIAVKTKDGEARFQIIASPAPGERYDEPETPVEGAPVAAGMTVRDDAHGAVKWLAHLLAGSGNKEINRIEGWSPQTVSQGLTAHFHSRARIYARLLRETRE